MFSVLFFIGHHQKGGGRFAIWAAGLRQKSVKFFENAIDKRDVFLYNNKAVEKAEHVAQ